MNRLISLVDTSINSLKLENTTDKLVIDCILNNENPFKYTNISAYSSNGFTYKDIFYGLKQIKTIKYTKI